jgi:MFS family permease
MQKKRFWIALMLFSLAMINYIDRVTLSFAAAPIAKEFDLSPVALGYLFSSFLWTYTLFLIPAGMLVDRFGAKRVAGFGIGLWSAATAATGIAWNFPILLATRLAMGAGEATSNPAGARVVREWIPASERGVTNAVFNSGSYAGPALCALVAGPIIAGFGWPFLFFAAGGIGFLWLLCWLTWFAPPEEAAWLGEEERQKILNERGAKKVDFGASSPKTGLIGLLRKGPTLWGLALTQGCNVYSQYLFLTWMPSYLQNAKGLTIAKTGFYAAIPYAIAVVLCIIVGRISDRLLKGDVGGGKRRYMIAFAMLLAAVILFAPWVDSVFDYVAQFRAPKRSSEETAGRRRRHGLPCRRWQHLWAAGAHRDRVRRRQYRELRPRLHYRRCFARRWCQLNPDTCASAFGRCIGRVAGRYPEPRDKGLRD